MIRPNTKILVGTVRTPVVSALIYFTPSGYIAEINGNLQLGDTCYDAQACKDMVLAWSNRPLNMRGVLVDTSAYKV